MGKYFGTDGVRGVANTELTPELAFQIGRCGGYVLTRRKTEGKPKVVIGRDTRISGHMLEAALVAGLLSIGAEVIRLGVITTPGAAYLTRALAADAGVMISASHNPVADNGIKFFGGDGFKLTDETEAEIEALLDKAGKSADGQVGSGSEVLHADNTVYAGYAGYADGLPRPTGAEVGHVLDYREGGQKYIAFLKSTIHTRLDGLKVVVDCANGAASSLAPQLLADLDADVITVCANPNGLNINDGCGSTNPQFVRDEVLKHGADVGLAFDGDADRLIAVDHEGNVIDGDYIMAICAASLQKRGRLKNNTVVSTVMSNIGFYKGLEKLGIKTVQTAVGDRYVMEEMRKGGFNLGGEQSGHIIFLDHNTTGDGLLSALQLLAVMREEGKSLKELSGIMQKYPQILVNVKVADKAVVLQNAELKETIRAVEEKLHGNGRVLVRPSGTEPIVRVMAEGPDESELERYVQEIVAAVERVNQAG